MRPKQSRPHSVLARPRIPTIFSPIRTLRRLSSPRPRPLTQSLSWRRSPLGKLFFAKNRWLRRWRTPIAQSLPRSRLVCLFKSVSIAGDTALTGVTHHTAAGRVQQTVRSDVNLFRDAYAEELASFVDAVRAHKEPCVTGVDARRALAIALASIESYKTNSPVLVHKKSF
jgi:hypothetical protein